MTDHPRIRRCSRCLLRDLAQQLPCLSIPSAVDPPSGVAGRRRGCHSRDRLRLLAQRRRPRRRPARPDPGSTAMGWTAGRRDVPIPPFIASMLDGYAGAYPPGPLGEVFTNTTGGPMRRTLFRSRIWRPALVRAGLLGQVAQLASDWFLASWRDAPAWSRPRNSPPNATPSNMSHGMPLGVSIFMTYGTRTPRGWCPKAYRSTMSPAS
jgi:hypothetical protein